MITVAWLMSLLLFFSQGELVVKVPSTGQAPAKGIIKRADGMLELVEFANSGVRVLAQIGKQLNISDEALVRMLPSNRPVVGFVNMHIRNTDWKFVATTGLRPDPSSSDSYTGKPLYVRRDDLLFFEKRGVAYNAVAKRSFDEINGLRLVRFSKMSDPFLVISTFEGQHNSLIHIFRMVAPGTVRELRLPEPKVDGRWREDVVEMDGSHIVSLAIKQFGSFPEAPGKKSKEISQSFAWDDDKQSFVKHSEQTKYE